MRLMAMSRLEDKYHKSVVVVRSDCIALCQMNDVHPMMWSFPGTHINTQTDRESDDLHSKDRLQDIAI